MAHHKDAIKRIKQNEKRRMRGRHYRSIMRNRIKAVRSAIEEGNLENANIALRAAMSALHRNASKGIIHSKNAKRQISRLNTAVKALL